MMGLCTQQVSGLRPHSTELHSFTSSLTIDVALLNQSVCGQLLSWGSQHVQKGTCLSSWCIHVQAASLAPNRDCHLCIQPLLFCHVWFAGKHAIEV